MKKHATTEFNDNGINYVVYHKTAVVKFNRDKIILNSGGWETPTTKDRMNATAHENGLCYYVYQKDFVWYVVLDNKKCYPFEDNMQLIEKLGYSVALDKYEVLNNNNKPIKADEKETKRYYKN